MYPAYLGLAGAVAFNIASYLVYKSIADAAPHVWWPKFTVGLMLGGTNAFLFARSIKAIPLSVAYPVFTGASLHSSRSRRPLPSTNASCRSISSASALL
jgi:multidrug transporter EmrE-like cation transporter